VVAGWIPLDVVAGCIPLAVVAGCIPLAVVVGCIPLVVVVGCVRLVAVVGHIHLVVAVGCIHLVVGIHLVAVHHILAVHRIQALDFVVLGADLLGILAGFHSRAWDWTVVVAAGSYAFASVLSFPFLFPLSAVPAPSALPSCPRRSPPWPIFQNSSWNSLRDSRAGSSTG